MKNCLDCKAHELHLQTLAKTLDSFHQKVVACRARKHDGRPLLISRDFSSVCVECLAVGFATSKVLSDQILSPVDEIGRPIMDSTSSPLAGGVWPIAERVQHEADRQRADFWVMMIGLFVLLIVTGAAVGFALYVVKHGPNL